MERQGRCSREKEKEIEIHLMGTYQAYSNYESATEDAREHNEDATTKEDDKKPFSAFWHRGLPEQLWDVFLHQ